MTTPNDPATRATADPRAVAPSDAIKAMGYEMWKTDCKVDDMEAPEEYEPHRTWYEALARGGYRALRNWEAEQVPADVTALVTEYGSWSQVGGAGQDTIEDANAVLREIKAARIALLRAWGRDRGCGVTQPQLYAWFMERRDRYGIGFELYASEMADGLMELLALSAPLAPQEGADDQ